MPPNNLMRLRKPNSSPFSPAGWPNEVARVVETIAQARRELAVGQCEVMSASEIIRGDLVADDLSTVEAD